MSRESIQDKDDDDDRWKQSVDALIAKLDELKELRRRREELIRELAVPEVLIRSLVGLDRGLRAGSGV